MIAETRETRAFFLALVAAIAMTPASAQTAVDSAVDKMVRSSASEVIERFRKNDLNTSIYIVGLKIGLEYANASLLFPPNGVRMKPIYCQPLKLGITLNQVVTITEDFIKSNPNMGKAEFVYAFREALIDTFPCEATSR